MFAKIQASIDDLMKETAANTRSIKKIKDQLKGHVDQDCRDLTEQGLDLPYRTLESFLAGEEKLNDSKELQRALVSEVSTNSVFYYSQFPSEVDTVTIGYCLVEGLKYILGEK